MTVQEQVDRAYRVAYRLVFPVVWCWWRLLKRHEGVVVAPEFLRTGTVRTSLA